MALREVLADLSVRIRGMAQLRAANANIGEAVAGLRGFGRVLGGVGAALSGALAVRELEQFVREMIHVGDELDKAAGRIGFATTELERWRFMAERSGVETQRLQQGLQALSRNAANAARGTGGAAQAFRRLHVQLRDAGGAMRGNDAIFDDAVRALAAVESTSERAALASQIFGEEAGAAIAAMAAQGGPAIEQLRARFDELGGGFGRDFPGAAAAAADAMTDFDLAMRSLKGQLAVAILPTVTRLVSTMAEWGGKISQVLQRSSALQVVLGALALAAGLVAASLLIIAAPVLIPLTALFLLVEDLVTMFRGGQSVIGDFIDELFGVGSAQAVVDGVTGAFEWLVDLLRDAGRLLGIINEESGRVRPRTAEEREAMRFLPKEETNPDGRERRDPGRRRREFVRARRARITEQLGALTVPLTADALMPSTTVPAAALSRAPAGGDTFNFGPMPITLNANGVNDPREFLEAVRPQIEDHAQRSLGRAASRHQQGRGR